MDDPSRPSAGSKVCTQLQEATLPHDSTILTETGARQIGGRKMRPRLQEATGVACWHATSKQGDAGASLVICDTKGSARCVHVRHDMALSQRGIE